MDAKSLGTPSTIESSAAPRHTRGSNHIWKTSSGKSDLKSHLTVSQRLEFRDDEGMYGLDGRIYSHSAPTTLPPCPQRLCRDQTQGGKLGSGPSPGRSEWGNV